MCYISVNITLVNIIWICHYGWYNDEILLVLLQSLTQELEKRQSLEEEMKIARGEALTLKRLLVAKDALVIKKSQQLIAAQVGSSIGSYNRNR